MRFKVAPLTKRTAEPPLPQSRVSALETRAPTVEAVARLLDAAGWELTAQPKEN